MANTVDYFEIGSGDPEGAGKFYGDLFDWPIGGAGEAGYRMVDGQAGGLMDTSSMGAGGWAIFYVHVDSVDDAVEKAVTLGATVLLPKTAIDTGAFAHLGDPQGNRFGVWQSHP
ncbi:VOC family protein [Specibacter cremeus]|uniref:VOC family protein n=1 Tax=Specibacter cremeus TaxID=1629051 RepID=UPI000F780DE6|nr:VOC family protein [Specibacter cremeus]